MKDDLLTSFAPAEVQIIKNAFELAKKTLESGRPLTKAEEDNLAREIIVLAKEGCLETERLADRAITRSL
jgi:hypothetical protein